MTHLMAVAALGCLQDRAQEFAIGIGRLANIVRGVFRLSLSGIETDLAEGFVGLLGVGVVVSDNSGHFRACVNGFLFYAFSD
jgi:hypothetical protein